MLQLSCLIVGSLKFLELDMRDNVFSVVKLLESRPLCQIR